MADGNCGCTNATRNVSASGAVIGKPLWSTGLRKRTVKAASGIPLLRDLAGVPLCDVHEAASHADPRTTMRYDRARRSLDRRATYSVVAYLASAAR